MSTNSIRQGYEGIQTASGNLANSKTPFARPGDFTLTQQAYDGKISTPKGQARQNLYNIGELSSTSRTLDLFSKSPDHMFVVAKDGDVAQGIYLVPGGSFEEYNDKIVYSGNKNLILMVNRNTGSAVAQQTFDKSELVPADISNFRISQPKKSTKIDILNTVVNKDKKLSNASGYINLDQGSETKLLLPKDGVQVGNQIVLKIPGRNNLEHKIEYGGVTNSYSVIDIGILGARTSSATFAAAANGDQLAITVAGQAYTFEFDSTIAEGATGKKFKNLESLARAINSKSDNSLFATIDSETGTLYVGAKDANASIAFGGILAPKFGFTNVAATLANGPKRFNTRNGLGEILKRLDGVATRKVGNKLEVTVGNVNEAADITAVARGTHTTSGVFITKRGAIATGNAGRGRELTIATPNHGLKVGELIDIDLPVGVNATATAAGLGLAARKYAVTSISPNSFTICGPGVIADYDAFVAAVKGVGQNWDNDAHVEPGESLNILDAAGLRNGIKWSKSMGTFNTAQASTAAASIANGGGVVTITSAGHGLANGDVVYVPASAFAAVGTSQAGYYVVANLNVNTFTITTALNNATGAPVVGPAINFQKVAATGAAGAITASTAINAVANGDQTARFNIANARSKYFANDIITLEGLVDAGVVVGGITLTNGQMLKIRTVNADSIDVELPNGATANSVAIATDNASFTNANSGFLNQAPIMFGDLGLNRRKMHWDSLYDAKVKDNTGANADKWSLSKLLATPDSQFPTYDKDHLMKLKSSVQISQNLRLYNSIGDLVEAQVLFAAAADDKVVYEVRVLEGDNGFPAKVDNNYGVVASGALSFNNLGQLTNASNDKVDVTFNNGELLSLDLNFSNVSGDGIRLAAGQQHIEADSDGYAASERNNEIEISNNQIVITYKNGQVYAPFNFVFGNVNNINYLKATDYGFTATAESGALRFYNATFANMPKVMSHTIENIASSGVVENQISILDWQKLIQYTTYAVTKEKATDQQVFEQVNRV